MISYSQTLKKLRSLNKMTQSDVADILGIDRSTYAYYEKGTTRPDLECILKLCKLYKVDLNQITNMLLQDEGTSITFKSLDNKEQGKESFFSRIDLLNVDEYEKMILLFYRQIPDSYKKLYFVRIKQIFDEFSSLIEDEK
ncbi:MAG: helix-turn-helix transcriptional regulator [Clostridia bacterium]|nr:helix-turn-helix transcriptional regulator [Clostridia bacterium]